VKALRNKIHHHQARLDEKLGKSKARLTEKLRKFGVNDIE
jgi:hypothetical protein